MRRILCILTICILTAFTASSEEMTITGIYQGENLFVMNPFASSGVGFCVYEVTVNGQITTDEINSSAFEIDLSVFKLNIGDKVVVVIKHKENCKPQVLNEDVLQPKSTFKVLEIVYDRKTNSLTWTTSGEKGSLPFQVEQYRWKKWVNVGTIDGNGSGGTNTYSVNVNTNSGMNKFRIKQVDFSKKPRYSQEATYRSLDPEVTFSPDKPKNDIFFSAITDFEIYDYYGRLVKKGRANRVDVSKLKKGDYFINWDNSMATFSKK